MNILYIIGNGFDINLGLKTRYSDFYNYYEKQQSDDVLVNKLKENIKLDLENWSDLELAFGMFTKNLNDIDEFDRVYEDIVDKLCDYLEAEELKFEHKNADTSKLLNDLYTPESSLALGFKEELINFKQRFGATTWKVDVITLNYTRTMERILNDKYSNTFIGSHTHGKVKFGDIQHIHGYTDDRVILGVNDETQLGKIDFRTNREILEALIKSVGNQAQQHQVDRKCVNYINSAQIICIFGSSIGETDNYLWIQIGEQLKRDFRLIIFKKGEAIKQRFGHKPARSQRAIKKLFLDRTNLTDEEKLQVECKIYVALNTEMFTL
ncbi:AbiH family protein [Sphingobacterium corticibacter]|uniref:Bacteriophage abortive infection AbiH n=1 Tax=Sphingobacterium corticibacter TaxID=2171749 RepID=A0A2T8HIA9_9SPHI|nr:AbiH family protein [Sphingobacterium corticibacter]PVH25145.1 hypothetical protein DC487_09445 [Sphingobacterium corticibacter]